MNNENTECFLINAARIYNFEACLEKRNIVIIQPLALYSQTMII